MHFTLYIWLFEQQHMFCVYILMTTAHIGHLSIGGSTMLIEYMVVSVLYLFVPKDT